MKSKYKFLILCAVLCFSMLSGFAQQKHFIYIQADNKQPFYVILNGKNYSSSSIGYIILSKLSNGTYDLHIGFPKDQYPEQQFSVKVDNKDYGYALKNSNEKGWALYNLQTKDVITSTTGSDNKSDSSQSASLKKKDLFGDMLSEVVNDSTLTQATAMANPNTNDISVDTVQTETETASAQVERKQTNTEQSANEQDPSIASVAPANEDTSAETTDATTTTETFNTKGVIKSEEKRTKDGTDLVFIDFNNLNNDTIRVFIPSSADVDTSTDGDLENSSTVAETTTSSDAASSVASNRTPSTKDIETSGTSSDKTKKISNPFYSGSSPDNTDTATASANDENTSTSTASTAPSMVKSFCTNMFTDKDVDRLKRKISSESDPDEKIRLVKKALRDKCITTDQVKTIGELFLSDETRYSFYDAVYPFVYDYGHYSVLENQLLDNYYKNRFKALLR